MAKEPNIFDELNAQIKAAEGKIPDTFEVGGVRYKREGAPTVRGPVVKKWKNPRTQKEEEREVESVTIDVAPHADRITLDGVIYLANRTYEVPTETARTMRDVIAQTWKHEAQTGGANSYNAGSVRNPANLAGRSGVGFMA